MGGDSHFNRLLNQLMAEYFTDERKIEFLLNCQKAGINTWQTGYNEHLFRLLREAGWKMNWLWLADLEPRSNSPGAPDVISQCRSIPETERPIGMVHHGETTDVFFREGKLDRIMTFINAVHDLGLLAGISTHNPRVVEAVEEKGWNNDFYMTCFYRESRRPEEFEKEIGVIPVGETYLSTDPPRMCAMIRQTRKPCLGFKILAAGRRCGIAGRCPQGLRVCLPEHQAQRRRNRRNVSALHRPDQRECGSGAGTRGVRVEKQSCQVMNPVILGVGSSEGNGAAAVASAGARSHGGGRSFSPNVQ